jgi:membrane-bound inhibitor of C-type lysozyme
VPRPLSPRAALVLLSLLAAACGKLAYLKELEPTDIPDPKLERGPLKPVVFRCKDGTAIRALFPRGGNSVVLTEQGEDYALPLVESASGARYSDGRWTLWTKGDEASLWRDDQTVRAACRAKE